MINLLPAGAEKEIAEEKKKTLILIFQIAFCLFLVSFGLTLFLFQIYLESEIGYQNVLLSEKGERLNEIGVAGFEKEIIDLNNRLGRISQFYSDQVDFSQILDRINQDLPPATYLTNFYFNRDKKPVKVSLFGFSPTREELMAFRQKLEGEKSWQNVNFPPDNWISPADIKFSVSFEVQ